MRIETYSENYKKEWDNFVTNSKNGTFLFYRDFMDYHSPRFKDLSLLFYDDNKLIALLPGNIKDNTFYSHQGLSYGGLVMSNDTTTLEVVTIFEHFTTTLRQHGIKEIIYKAIPHIYHTTPSEEDLYALFINKGQLVGRGISSAILLSNKIEYSKSRTRGVKKANEANLQVRESYDFEEFWTILSNNLHAKYQTKPVHSREEILLLKSRFPKSIILYGVYDQDGKLVAGEVVFNTTTVVHAQYTAATEEGREAGAIDLVINHIIQNADDDKIYFDYGISTENNGLYLNEGLIYQKEGFGARGIVYDIYSIKLI